MRYLTGEPSNLLYPAAWQISAERNRAMSKVTVCKVKCFDVIRGEVRILRSMATRSGARLLGDGFEIVEGSGLEIDASQLEHGEPWTRSDFAA